MLVKGGWLTEQEAAKVASAAKALVANVERAIVGKPEAVRLCVAALLAGGHVLIEDVPGVGKTALAKALAKSIGGEFKRIQFTADLLPADITGSYVFNQAENRFEFRPGPIFANVVLADEINRGSPKTQAALLEAMDEGRVTADGVPHELPRPFFLIATENPVEAEGVYPLPEAELDRFMFRVSLGYLDVRGEREMMARHIAGEPAERLEPVVGSEQVVELQRAIMRVYVAAEVLDYIARIVDATRKAGEVLLGASPRGSLALMRGGQAWAAMQGRNFVAPEDVKQLSVPALAHRILLRPEAEGAGTAEAAQRVIGDILRRVEVPLR